MLNANIQQFRITSNGTLYTVFTLDREEHDKLCATIKVHDNPTDLAQRKSSTHNVCIIILDENDSVPTFIVPANNSCVFTLPYDSNIGHVIVDIYARDDDQPGHDNNRVQYGLEENPYKLFSIDINSGTVTLARKLNMQDVKLHRVLVLAIDQGINPQSNVQVSLL